MKSKKFAVVIIFISIIIIICTLFLNNKNKTSSKWEKYKNFYTTVVHNTGENESSKKYLTIAKRSEKLLPLLEEKAGAFIMDSYNYQDIDENGTPLYEMNNLKYPKEIDPNGESIRISKNYLKYNIIKGVNNKPIENQMIYDDLTLNILVPKKYKSKEKQILKAYKDNFYFEKVTAENDYNKMADIKERMDIKKNDLKINIIYVKDGQKYFTFNKESASKTDNYITDCIVQIYTHNIHCNYAHSFLTQSTFLYSKKENEKEVYNDILIYLKECNAQKSVKRVVSLSKLYN